MKAISTNALSMNLNADLLPLVHLSGAPEEAVSSIRVRAQLDALLKKTAESVEPTADARALEKFLAVNERCGNWTLKIESLEDEFLVGHLKQVLASFFYRDRGGLCPILTSLGQILSKGTVGPGASIGSRENSFYTKLFGSDLSTTSPGLYRAYASYIEQFPAWAESEDSRYELCGPPSVVKGNKLSFVPKNDKISRVICIEPVLNMFYQQGIKAVLEKRLIERFGINISRPLDANGNVLPVDCVQQEKNRELARVGSMNDGDKSLSSLNKNFVTIDLSSASDSLAMPMLKEFFPAAVMQWLELTRSKVCRLPSGEEIGLNMVSTMGNAFTFPLQTALFTSVVVACFQVAGLEDSLSPPFGSHLGNYGVYGDDIICPHVVSRKVLRLLDLLGFQVNVDKTFVEGHFRESCGADYYGGINVRPVYASSLADTQDCYSLLNRLNRWCYSNGIPLWNTCGYLLSRLQDREVLRVPAWESDDAGVHIPLAKFVDRKIPKKDPVYGDEQLHGYVYKRRTPRQLKIAVDDDRQWVWHPSVGNDPLVYNSSGLYLAFLKGNIVNGCILSRPREVRYTTKAAYAPNWEYTQTVQNPYLSSGGGAGLENLRYCVFPTR